MSGQTRKETLKFSISAPLAHTLARSRDHVWNNQSSVFRSRDLYCPITGQYSGHVIMYCPIRAQYSPDGLAVEQGEGQDPDAHPGRAPHLCHVTAHLEILTNLN